LTPKKGKVSHFTEGGKERETKKKEHVESSPEVNYVVPLMYF
jgi:hypothetical protein